MRKPAGTIKEQMEALEELYRDEEKKSRRKRTKKSKERLDVDLGAFECSLYHDKCKGG